MNGLILGYESSCGRFFFIIKLRLHELIFEGRTLFESLAHEGDLYETKASAKEQKNILFI